MAVVYCKCEPIKVDAYTPSSRWVHQQGCPRIRFNEDARYALKRNETQEARQMRKWKLSQCSCGPFPKGFWPDETFLHIESCICEPKLYDWKPKDSSCQCEALKKQISNMEIEINALKMRLNLLEMQFMESRPTVCYSVQ